jgi:hypothetical protein
VDYGNTFPTLSVGTNSESAQPALGIGVRQHQFALREMVWEKVTWTAIYCWPGVTDPGLCVAWGFKQTEEDNARILCRLECSVVDHGRSLPAG